MKKAIRKLTILTLTACMILMLGSVVTSHASVWGGYIGDVPKTEVDITVDGEEDPIYAYGLSIEVKYEKDRPVKATGTAKLLYADGKLYVFARVNDNDVREPDQEGRDTSPWITDSFEFFINLDNDDDVSKVKQYRVDCGGWPTVYDQNGLRDYGPKAAEKHFTYAAKKVDGGYCTEMAIPVDALGKDIGVNLQINDVNTDAEELTWAMVYSEATDGGTDSWSVGIYPYISIGAYSEASLDGKVVQETPTPEGYTPEPTAEPTPGDDEGTDNNEKDQRKGLSPAVIAVICVLAAAVIAAAVIMIIRGKKKSGNKA